LNNNNKDKRIFTDKIIIEIPTKIKIISIIIPIPTLFIKDKLINIATIASRNRTKPPIN